MSAVSLGVVWGLVIAVLHTAAGLVVYRWGRSLGPRRSIGVLMGGILLRGGLALAGVVALIWTVSVDRTALVLTLFLAIGAGLVLEVALLHRTHQSE